MAIIVHFVHKDTDKIALVKNTLYLTLKEKLALLFQIVSLHVILCCSIIYGIWHTNEYNVINLSPGWQMC